MNFMTMLSPVYYLTSNFWIKTIHISELTYIYTKCIYSVTFYLLNQQLVLLYVEQNQLKHVE